MRALRVTCVAGAIILLFAGPSISADYRGFRHHRLRPLPPPGYAYGGYGNGRGPGWVAAHDPGFAPGMTPGWGYIPAGAPPTVFDLGY